MCSPSERKKKSPFAGMFGKGKNKLKENASLLPNTSWESYEVTIKAEDEEPPPEPSSTHYIRPGRVNRRYIKLNEKKCLVDAPTEGYIMFPTGLVFRTIENNNPFDVELRIDVGGYPTRTFVIAENSTAHNIRAVMCPPENEPRGQRWCEQFGVITEGLLDKGIVEKRDDGSMVAWNTFRHTPQQKTPFGLWKNNAGNSRYCVYSPQEYVDLKEACVAFQTTKTTLECKPLFKGNRPHDDGNTYIILESRSPFLFHTTCSDELV